MATAEHIPGSILSSVVEHEKSLLLKLHESREAARATIDRAKLEAVELLQAEEGRLSDETAAMRRSAEAERNRDFQAALDAAEAQLVGVRQRASERVPAVADKVLELFVPKTAGETKS